MLSNTSKYAIRAVIYLELYSSAVKKIGIREISKELGIPTAFLGKILQMLAKREVLDSTKGPHGGFNLKKPAMDISLLEIIEIIDGPNVFNQCVTMTSSCQHESRCSLHDKIAPYMDEIKRLLLTESIADMASEFRKGNKCIRI